MYKESFEGEEEPSLRWLRMFGRSPEK